MLKRPKRLGVNTGGSEALAAIAVETTPDLGTASTGKAMAVHMMAGLLAVDGTRATNRQR